MTTRRSILAVLFVLLALAPRLRAQGYSTAPLREPVAWPANDLPRSAEGLLAWFRDHPGQIEWTEHDRLREQIYAVLAEKVKTRFAATGSTELIPRDPAMALLMAEADRIGVMNAAPLVDRLGGHQQGWASAPGRSEFALTFDGPTFTLTSLHAGWSVRFPYYMALRGAHWVDQPGDPHFDVLNLFTLPAAHRSDAGASQATILIVAQPGAELAPFIARFHGTFYFYRRDSVAALLPGALRSFRGQDAARHARYEASIFRIPSGLLAVQYWGEDGAYEANRESYLDLVASLQTR